MMSRAYVVYFVMFAALVGGMLLIVTMGDAVRAPDDLSGDWVVEWDNAPPPESGEPKMRIAQSGRFFVVRFGQAPPLSMTLQDGWTGRADGRKLDMRLARRRPQAELRLNGPIPAAKEQWRVPELQLELVGQTGKSGAATRHIGIARRVRPETAQNAPNDRSVPAPAPAPAATPATPAEAAEPAKAAARGPTINPAPAAPAAAAQAETAHAR
jgi:hypothetical protein